jgi:hypothetical protein
MELNQTLEKKMPYCYFVVTPNFGDDGRDRLANNNSKTEFIYCKFGITNNADFDAIRTGYSTHNPSYRFLKFAYDNNIIGVNVTVGKYPDVETRTCTRDLGKDLQFILFKKGWTQVGNTEWMNSTGVDGVIAFFTYLSKFDNVRITKDNVSSLLTSIYKGGV